MDTALIVALVAGAVALASAAGNVWSSVRNTEKANANVRAIEQMRAEGEAARAAAARQREVSSTIEPWIRAAYDLQSRLFNILQKGLIDRYLVNGDARERAYVVENTCFVIAQFLCWTELIRRDLQFVDLESSGRALDLLGLQDRLYDLWGTDALPRPLRIFAGEQRAIGELLIRSGEGGSECMGYGAFLKHLPAGTDDLLDHLRADVLSLAGDLPRARDRLVRLQHALIDLLDLLDPQHIRFPRERRSKV